jgi:hypothetical protein
VIEISKMEEKGGKSKFSKPEELYIYGILGQLSCRTVCGITGYGQQRAAPPCLSGKPPGLSCFLREPGLNGACLSTGPTPTSCK